MDLTLSRIFDVPHISQVYLFYRCGIENDEFGIGPESLESALFGVGVSNGQGATQRIPPGSTGG